MVGTPIGNLKDITIRALEVLKAADYIACEDTRHSLRLLNAHGIKKPLVSCRSHNEAKAAEHLVDLLDKGHVIAYVSDAGTPGLSDPGNVLAGIVRNAGFDVIPIPGPSAFSSLVSISSFGGRTVTFDGFLSPKPGKRRKRLSQLLEREEGAIIYESPFRIVKLLADLADLESERQILIGREMTKVHEEYLEGTAKALYEDFSSRSTIKGEFALFISGKKND